MIEATILTFRFNYMNSHGIPRNFLTGLGSVNRNGVVLGRNRIMYEDIYRVEQFKNRIIISLFPYPTVSKALATHFVGDHASIILQIGRFANNVKSTIDQRISALEVQERLDGMTKKEKESRLKTKTCPNCSANIDLTDLPSTPYLYCKYCKTIFDKHGYELPGGNGYGICPETGYFDRLDEHRNVQVYYLVKEKGFKTHKFYGSDALAEKFLKEYGVKNMLFGIGTVASLWDNYWSKRKRHPSYKFLTEGNVFAMQGNLDEAREMYYKVLLQHPDHPGVHLNYALAFLEKGEEQQALLHLKKSIKGCANYKPTKDILRKYTWNEEIE